MASSSVSQEDSAAAVLARYDDPAKNLRRTRIRTARATRIGDGNSSNSVVNSSSVVNNDHVEHVEPLDENDADHNDKNGGNMDGNGVSSKELLMGLSNSSPKQLCRNGGNVGVKTEKRLGPPKVSKSSLLKGHHGRERRKLREKRRSTGVLHLASTESTGGSTTTGDDDGEISDAPVNCSNIVNNSDNVNNLAEPADNEEAAGKGNDGKNTDGPVMAAEETAANAMLLKNRLLSDFSDDLDEHLSPSSQSSKVAMFSRHHHHHHHTRRAKSPSDLEADDENDHDSRNPSRSSSNVSSATHIPGLTSATNSDEIFYEHKPLSNFKSSSKVNNEARGASDISLKSGSVDDRNEGGIPVDRLFEENRRLVTLMEEKDRKIQVLEFKIQQLMRDTRNISEEQARLKKENSSLIKALNNASRGKNKE